MRVTTIKAKAVLVTDFCAHLDLAAVDFFFLFLVS